MAAGFAWAAIGTETDGSITCPASVNGVVGFKPTVGALHRGAVITGNAFDVLSTVDGVSKEFLWDLGSGHCGKGQPAKVDAGRPYLRCNVLLGGVQ